MTLQFQTGATTDTENPARVTFTPTGESAEEGRVTLAPLDFSTAMKGLLATRQDDKEKAPKRHR